MLCYYFAFMFILTLINFQWRRIWGVVQIERHIWRFCLKLVCFCFKINNSLFFSNFQDSTLTEEYADTLIFWFQA